jgi:hypothetical protein
MNQKMSFLVSLHLVVLQLPKKIRNANLIVVMVMVRAWVVVDGGIVEPRKSLDVYASSEVEIILLYYSIVY